MEKEKALIEFYTYGSSINKTNNPSYRDGNFISEDEILRLCKNIDLEKMFNLFFDKHEGSRLQIEKYCGEDDYFEASITKENDNFYVWCQDDYEDFYRTSHTLTITEYLRGVKYASSFIKDIDLINDYNWKEFKIPYLIADTIRSDLYKNNTNELNCSIDQYIADELDNDVCFLIEWLRIKYEYPDKYEEFKNNFKELIYKILFINFIKVFNKDSKYMDGFTYVKLNNDLVLNGQTLFINRVKSLDKTDLKVKDLYDKILSLIKAYSNKELTICTNPLKQYISDMEDGYFYDENNYLKEQIKSKEYSTFDNSIVFSICFRVEAEEYCFWDIDSLSKMLVVDFIFIPRHHNDEKIKDMPMEYLFNRYNIKIKDALFVYNKEDLEKVVRDKIVLNKFNFIK